MKRYEISGPASGLNFDLLKLLRRPTRSAFQGIFAGRQLIESIVRTTLIVRNPPSVNLCLGFVNRPGSATILSLS